MARKSSPGKDQANKQDSKDEDLTDTRPEASEESAESPMAEAPETAPEAVGEAAETPEATADQAEAEAESDTVDAARSSAPEDAEEAPAETGSAVVPMPTRSRPSDGLSAFALVFGGILAGAAGFLIATFAVPDGWPNPPTESVDAQTVATLDAAIAGQAARIEDLEAALAAVAAAPQEVEPVDLSPLSARIDEIAARLDDLSDRIDAVGTGAEPSVTLDVGPELDAQLRDFRAELEAVTAAARAEIEAAEARASEIEAQAAAEAEAAARRAALAEIEASLSDGSAYAAALSAFDAVPAPLSGPAEEGVPTLAALQADFPDAARAALREVQVVPGDATVGDRVVAFLRRQTNARSLSPRDGEDADAILSRAEAALAGGDLGAALSELATLPEKSAAAMSGWIARAETRQAAVEAASGLMSTTN